MSEWEEVLRSARETLRRGGLSERAVEMGVVLPVLRRLGWNDEDLSQMCPEFGVGANRVDWALLGPGGKALVFMELKAPDQRLAAHEEQLLRYSFEQGVGLAVLTNGHEWWLYLPLVEGEWAARRFAQLNLLEEEDTTVEETLRRFLERERVCRGAARQEAEERHRRNREQQRIREQLPVILRQILASPSDFIIEVFQNEVQGELGALPPAEQVAEALRGLVAEPRSAVPSRPAPAAAREQTIKAPRRKPAAERDTLRYWVKTVTGRRPKSMTIGDDQWAIRTWKEVLVNTAKWLVARGASLPVDQPIGQAKQPLISRDQQKLREAKAIGKGLFIETHMSGSGCVFEARRLLALAGYDPDLLKIEFE